MLANHDHWLNAGGEDWPGVGQGDDALFGQEFAQGVAVAIGQERSGHQVGVAATGQQQFQAALEKQHPGIELAVRTAKAPAEFGPAAAAKAVFATQVGRIGNHDVEAGRPAGLGVRRCGQAVGAAQIAGGAGVRRAGQQAQSPATATDHQRIDVAAEEVALHHPAQRCARITCLADPAAESLL